MSQNATVPPAFPDRKQRAVAFFDLTMQDISPETIYQAYPRHVGKQDAIRAIRKAMRLHDPAWLLARVQLYARSPDGQAGKFTPHPATWFNRGSYEDDDREWFRRGDKPLPPALDSIKTPLGIASAFREGLANRIDGKRAFILSAFEAEVVALIDGERVKIDRNDAKKVRLTLDSTP